jgi:type 1 fimbriae regulatory protein FimE
MMTGDVGQRHVVFHAGLEHPIALEGSRPLLGRQCRQRQSVVRWPRHHKLVMIGGKHQNIAEKVLFSATRYQSINTISKGSPMSQQRHQCSFSAKFKPGGLSTPPIKKKRSPAVRDYLRPEEVEAMVQAARKAGRHRVRDAAIILMMFRHGLRTAELVALRWHQVDLNAGYLDVHRAKRGHHAKHPLRGPQLRLVRELQRVYPDSPDVFVFERKAPLSPRSIREIVARAGKLAGLPFVPHPHQLRHACGYYLASRGHDTRAMQDYLGHQNIQHTVRYTAMAPDRFERFWQD